MIGNKIADKISLEVKKRKENEEGIYIPPEKRQQIIDLTPCKYGIPKNYRNITQHT